MVGPGSCRGQWRGPQGDRATQKIYPCSQRLTQTDGRVGRRLWNTQWRESLGDIIIIINIINRSHFLALTVSWEGAKYLIHQLI